ncbi:DUF685 domain-containing protein, partial [Borrelia persica]|uniref:DUF685 domain-containing protein n=1 Tax=Borrelia persica TaxID=44448 RepID=UPI00056E6089
YSLLNRRYIFELGSSSRQSENEEIIIQTDRSYDDKPIYLIVKVKVISNSTSQATKRVSIQYNSDSSTNRTIFRLASVHGGTLFENNILEGWYMQKRVDGIPLLLKL